MNTEISEHKYLKKFEEKYLNDETAVEFYNNELPLINGYKLYETKKDPRDIMSFSVFMTLWRNYNICKVVKEITYTELLSVISPIISENTDKIYKLPYSKRFMISIIAMFGYHQDGVRYINYLCHWFFTKVKNMKLLTIREKSALRSIHKLYIIYIRNKYRPPDLNNPNDKGGKGYQAKLNIYINDTLPNFDKNFNKTLYEFQSSSSFNNNGGGSLDENDGDE